mgnify:CR=1 FL=1
MYWLAQWIIGLHLVRFIKFRDIYLEQNTQHCHSREGGNPFRMNQKTLDPRLRGDDITIYLTVSII